MFLLLLEAMRFVQRLMMSVSGGLMDVFGGRLFKCVQDVLYGL